MRWPFVCRAAHEAELRRVDAAWVEVCDTQRESANRFIAEAQSHARQAIDFCKEDRARYDALLEKYHALRVNGADPAPAYSHQVTEPFGPLTRAALHDMGVGQTGPVKRAMQAKTQVIWLENRSHDNQDELTAIAVRQGETRRT